MRLRLKDARPLIYLSGNGSSNINEMDLIDQGCKYRCYSYAYTCKGAFYYTKKMAEALECSIKNNVGVMMDSAAHSIHQLSSKGMRKRKGKFRVDDVEELIKIVKNQYLKYVLKEGKHWDFYVNFDYVKNCPIIYDMQKELERKGIKPIPVYHGDRTIDWLRRYCEEGYKLIGIASVRSYGPYKDKRRYYDEVFNVTEKYGALTHGFAMTGLSLMFGYPWYSVDSATWAKTAAYGSILHADRNRNVIGEIHITDKVVQGKTRYNQLPKDLQKDLKRIVEKSGFDFEQLRVDGRMRSLYNVNLFCNHFMDLKKVVSSDRKRWKLLV
jgi:hypothetical protein